MPGLAYNPLFICGPPGLGKTHLLHSIGNYILEHGDGLTVRYTTVEAFTDHFVGALHARKLEAFKAAYRTVDVLLVDDVQFLVGKARTEEEFFHTFNELHQRGKQLVLTSDRLPRDIDALEDRLRERFEAGLVSDVRPADRATRLTILRKRVIQDDVGDVEPAALELIADRVDTNLRALEGALIRVVAFGSLTGRPVTAALAAEVLDGLYPELKPRRATAARDPGADRRRLRRLARGPRVLLARPVGRLAAAGGHVPRARADRGHAARDRPGVRQPQPHHGHARLPAHRGAHRLRPRGVRSGARPLPATRRILMRSGAPDRLRQFTHSPCADCFPRRSGLRGTCAHHEQLL